MLRLHDIDALADENAPHCGDRLPDCLLFCAAHLPHDIRLHAPARAQRSLNPLDLRTIGVEIRPLLRTHADPQILPRRDNARNVIPVALNLALRDKERPMHPLPLHLGQYLIQRFLFGKAAKGKYDSGLHRGDESLRLCNPSTVCRTQLLIIRRCSFFHTDAQTEEAEYADQNAERIPVPHKPLPFHTKIIFIDCAAARYPYFRRAAICSRTQCRDWRQV